MNINDNNNRDNDNLLDRILLTATVVSSRRYPDAVQELHETI